MSYKRINVCKTHPEDKPPSAISVHTTYFGLLL